MADEVRRPVAVVTGASSGIGAASARHLAAAGYHVVAAARRAGRIAELAAEIDGTAVPCDVTDPAQVTALAAAVDRIDGDCRVLVNNAGGAYGLDPVETADLADWDTMYQVNVVGTQRVTAALLPALTASRRGTIVMITSTAAHGVYEGGAGYTAAKHAEQAVTETLRLELSGRPVRVVEIAPGMVATEEFSLTRFHGDSDRAAKVYEGVPEPLTADDIAECVAWTVGLPQHVNVDRLVVRPLAQAANHKVFKGRIG
ncbi:SDR family oxidoreductase [Actinocatenispora rupis]|uniref:Oxidoreductase n=1 Tax=Actinocatenispora rupis TaxID=519421 RepID=A0A8J3J7W3_9ACTN|nr:SDR family oxidoreductase [Actinocatenispora rupis]GID13622.1 oxidoreductase [Actinocatenispora rupis]